MNRSLICRAIPCGIFAGMCFHLIAASHAPIGSFADGQMQAAVCHVLAEVTADESAALPVKVKATPAEIGEPRILGYRVDESLLKNYPHDVAHAIRAKQTVLGYIRILAVSESGSRIAYQMFRHAHHDKESGRWIFLEDLDSQEELDRIEIAPRGFGGGAPFAEIPPHRRFLPGNRFVVFEAGVKIRDLADSKKTIDCADSERGRILDVSPGGKLICGVSKFGELVLWSTADGKVVHRLGESDTQRILAARFSRSGRSLISEHSVIVQEPSKPRVCELQARLSDCSTGKSLGRVGDPLRIPLKDGQCEASLAGRQLDDVGALDSGFEVAVSPTGIVAAVPLPERGLMVRRSGDHCIELLDPFDRELARIELEDATVKQFFLCEDYSVLFVGVKLNQTAVWLVWNIQPVTKKLMGSPELEHEDRDRIRRELKSDNMLVARGAYARLGAAPPSQIVALINELVKPSKSVDGIKELLDELDSDEPSRRAAAQKQLLAGGEQAIIALKEAMIRSKSPDFVQRAAAIIGEWNREHWSDSRMAVWCIHLLGHTQSPAARRLLETLANGAPGSWITSESQKVLDSLKNGTPN